MATHSSTPAWKIHGRRSLVGCSPWGCKELGMTERLPFHFPLSGIGEGNGNPLQCSCLENPRDGGAWWAAIYGVAQSRTRLTRLSSSSSSSSFHVLLIVGFPGGSDDNETACNVGDPGSIPGSGRYAGEGIGHPLQYSGLENSMDCTVHEVAKSWTQLSDFHFHYVKDTLHNGEGCSGRREDDRLRGLNNIIK